MPNHDLYPDYFCDPHCPGHYYPNQWCNEKDPITGEWRG